MDSFQQAAQQGASAASKINASTPTTGTGTPLMIVVTYLLYTECLLIVLLSVPYHVPYRRELMQWIHSSPKLWQVRVVIVCVNAFLAVLLADTYLRLDRITAQITAIQSQHLTPGMPSPPVDGSSHVNSLSELFASRFRGQRDFYVISFTLFCSTVLYQLHLLLMKLGRYRQERNDLRTRLYPSKYPAQQSPTEQVKARVAQTAQAVTDAKDRSVQSVLDVKNKVVETVDGLVHGSAANAEGPIVDSTKPVVAPVSPTPVAVVETVNVKPIVGVEARRGYTVATE